MSEEHTETRGPMRGSCLCGRVTLQLNKVVENGLCRASRLLIHPVLLQPLTIHAKKRLHAR
jgi:hypothetical protein